MPEENQPQNNEDIEQALIEAEKALLELKQRHQEIKENQQRKEELLIIKQELKQKQKQNHTTEPLKTQLRHIQQELENIELNLESRLISWSSFKEIFWQVVRFTGIGIVIGWILKSCAG